MIGIREACQEDYSKMEKTARGAFCSTCETDTFDFREMSEREINIVLLENKGTHLCGRFKVGQLKELNASFYAWENQRTKTFQSKFILALVLVFGLTMFSCDNASKTVITSINNTEIIEDNLPQALYINNFLESKHFDLVDFVAVVPQKEHTRPEIVQLENYILGEIAYFPEEDSMIIDRPIIQRPEIMGKFLPMDRYSTYLENNSSDTLACEEK